MAETLARVGTESRNFKDAANDRAIETWYGKTLGSLGVVSAVTVPHKGTGARSRYSEVMKRHILAALDMYALVDYEEFYSSTLIPVGSFVKIEYRNDIVGWINFFGGVPYTVELTTNNTTGKYGLRRILDWDREPPRGGPLPHHRTCGSVSGGSADQGKAGAVPGKTRRPVRRGGLRKHVVRGHRPICSMDIGIPVRYNPPDGTYALKLYSTSMK